MPDNWGYVAAAYAAAAVFLGTYWRYLARRARELDRRHLRHRPRPLTSHPTSDSHGPAS
jgi:hypothetical protein